MAQLKDLVVLGKSRFIGDLYANKIVGTIEGKISDADRATSDNLDQNIASTYIKNIAVDGKTITYTKGDGTFASFNTQDTTYEQATADTLGLVKVVGSTGTSTTDVMSQKAVTDALNNIQPEVSNAFIDAALAKDDTGVRRLNFTRGNGSTVEYDLSFAQATNNVLGLVKVQGSTGTSTTDVMSQKAVTDALNNIQPDNVLTEVNLTKDNTGTRVLTFTKGDGSTSDYDLSFAQATDSVLGLVKVNGSTGTSTTDVMSQKATSDAVNSKVESVVMTKQDNTRALTFTKGDGSTAEYDLSYSQANDTILGLVKVQGSTGTSTTDVMSQKATSDAVNNKLESVSLSKDNIGTRVLTFTKGDGSTVDYDLSFAQATDSVLGLVKVNGSTGTSTTDVMSQKAVTDELTNLDTRLTPIEDISSNFTIENGKLCYIASDGTNSGNESNSTVEPLTLDETLQDIADTLGNISQNISDVSAATAAQTTTNWLNQHVDPSRDVVIDDSLTISGAAADAKVTGDKIGEVKSALTDVNNRFHEEYASHNFFTAEGEGGYYYSDGTKSSSTAGYTRTKDGFKIPTGVTQIYLFINPEATYTGLLNVVFYSTSDVSGFIETKALMSNGAKKGTCPVPQNATYLRLYTNNVSFDMANICIWMTNKYGYEAYVGLQKNLKYSHLDTETRNKFADLATAESNIEDLQDYYYSDLQTANILPPVSEYGYYSPTDGTPIESFSYQRTPFAIKIDDTNKYVKVQIPELTQSARLLCLLWYSGAEPTQANFIGQANIDTSQNTHFERTLPNNATYVQLYASGENFDFADVCVSQSDVSFESYLEYKRLKDEHVNGNMLERVDRTDRLAKLKILNLGDSIFGKYSAPDDISTYITDLIGATTYNCGFGGCMMGVHPRSTWNQFTAQAIAKAINDGDWSAQEAALEVTTPEENVLPAYFADHLNTLENLDFSTIDIITIAYGTNDYQYSAVHRPEDDPNNPLNTNTFKGAMRYTIEKINSAYPNCRLIFCTPIYRYWNEGGVFAYDSNTSPQPDGTATLITFGQWVKDVCNEYNIPCIDNYYIGIGKFTRSEYFSGADTTHPNTKGLMLIAEHICKELF